jgi:hypothetical protein
MTISQLAQSSDIYPIGTIGTTVTLARKLGSQHILHIKNGELDNDKAMVLLSIQFFPLLLHVHVSRVSYTNIALFHVAAAIVRYLFKFVFVNVTSIS